MQPVGWGVAAAIGVATSTVALAGTEAVTAATDAVAPATMAGSAATSAVLAPPRRNPIRVPDGPYRRLDLDAASGDLAAVRAAIAGFHAALASGDNEGDVAWRLAKAYFHLYDELPASDDNERPQAAKRAVEWGERAIAASDSAEAKYWYAQALLALSDVRGALTFLARVRTVKAMMRDVLATEPGIDDGGPDRFFAILYDRAPWPFGDASAADRHARSAYERAPYRCANVLVAGKAKLAAGEYAAAVSHADALISNACTASSPMWDHIYRDYGSKLRSDIQQAQARE